MIISCVSKQAYNRLKPLALSRFRAVCLRFLKLFYVLNKKENKENMFDFQFFFLKNTENKKKKTLKLREEEFLENAKTVFCLFKNCYKE